MRLANCLSSNIITRGDCLNLDSFAVTYALAIAALALLAYLASRYI